MQEFKRRGRGIFYLNDCFRMAGTGGDHIDLFYLDLVVGWNKRASHKNLDTADEAWFFT